MIIPLIRCESGQEAILAFCDTRDFFTRVRHHHSGDVDVMRQCRRLELALNQDGWRGNVEKLVTLEMKSGGELPDQFLQASEFERK